MQEVTDLYGTLACSLLPDRCVHSFCPVLLSHTDIRISFSMASRSIEPLHVLDNSTSLIGTESLHRSGVDNVRILSRSRFLDIIRGTIEEYLSEALLSGGAEGSTQTAANYTRLATEFQSRWQELRTRHQASLSQIESRLERLSRLFVQMEKTLKRCESTPQARRTLTRMELLREMLLDEPKDVV